MSYLEEKTRAIETARQLLQKTKTRRAPVNVFAIAHQLGIILNDEIELPDDVSGLIKRNGKNGQPVMVINRRHTKERRRFTTAHEIGHFLLHVLDPVHVDAAHIYFRESKSRGFDVREAQANAFAAELLMPTELLTEDMNEGIAMDGSSDLIPKLAQKYEVSQEAMVIRINTLLQVM